MTATDYTPGDNPVPVGSVVEYFGSLNAGRYTVTEHQAPTSHPTRAFTPQEAAEAYPDGTAYDLWPEGVLHKFGNRDCSVHYVRRTSFTVVSTPEAQKKENS